MRLFLGYCLYPLQNAFNIIFHFICRQPDKPDAVVLYNFLPDSVPVPVVRTLMYCAINLNNQAFLMAVEIHDA